MRTYITASSHNDKNIAKATIQKKIRNAKLGKGKYQCLCSNFILAAKTNIHTVCCNSRNIKTVDETPSAMRILLRATAVKSDQLMFP